LSIIPSFLLKKLYKKGSLRQIEEGIAFDLKNILGPGFITGINFVKINDMEYNSSVIKIIKSGVATLAEHVTHDSPLLIKLNEEITCILDTCISEPAAQLQQGINNIIVELISMDAGKVQVNLSDTL